MFSVKVKERQEGNVERLGLEVIFCEVVLKFVLHNASLDTFGNFKPRGDTESDVIAGTHVPIQIDETAMENLLSLRSPTDVLACVTTTHVDTIRRQMKGSGSDT